MAQRRLGGPRTISSALWWTADLLHLLHKCIFLVWMGCPFSSHLRLTSSSGLIGFQGSYLSDWVIKRSRPVTGSMRHAGQKLPTVLKQELQGAPSPDAWSHQSPHHGTSVEVSLLSFNPLHAVAHRREDMWKVWDWIKPGTFFFKAPGWQKQALLERLRP